MFNKIKEYIKKAQLDRMVFVLKKGINFRKYVYKSPNDDIIKVTNHQMMIKN